MAGTVLSITESGDPADRVADFVPRIFLGNTSTGPVTCIDSYLQPQTRTLVEFSASPLQQTWDIQTLIVGSHLPKGHRTEFDAVRFVLDAPTWWSHLLKGDSVAEDVGQIRCTRSEEGQVWLEFYPSRPLFLRSAQRVVLSVTTLAKLALDKELTPVRVQIREVGNGQWLDVHTRNETPLGSLRPSPDDFLPADSLTLERIAKWWTIEQTMDGLAAAVAEPLSDVAIQAKALIACSLVEGIHKRIKGGKSKYVDRVTELHEISSRIESSITDPIEDWPALVRKARNDLAHHNPIVSLDEQVYNWILTTPSVIWVLRLCLLSHAGFTDEELRYALAIHQRYQFYRENLKIHVKERDAVIRHSDI